MSKNITALWLKDRIKDNTMLGITQQLIVLINSGEIPAGTTLPSVRELAKVLGVSPATVSATWSKLRKYNMITGMGRQGTTVIGSSVVSIPLRHVKSNGINTPILIDLTYSIEDPQLLPDFSAAISQAVAVKDLNGHQRQPIIQALSDSVKPMWPYTAPAFMAVDNIFEAITLLLKTIILPGSLVAVEDPTTMSVLDILKEMAIEVIHVKCDKEGPIPLSLAQVLERKPVAFIYQPNISTPSGYQLTQRRMNQLRALFKSSSTLIIEQDITGAITNRAFPSLGTYYPEQTIHIRSYFRTYGPDFGLAVLSASDRIVKQLQDTLGLFSIGWTNRLLQQILVWLLNDCKTQQCVKQARQTYEKRYNTLINALKIRGVHLSLPCGDGTSLWLKVPSKESAMTILAENGISVLGSDYFSHNSLPYIRVATNLLTTEFVDKVADALAIILKPAYSFSTQKTFYRNITTPINQVKKSLI